MKNIVIFNHVRETGQERIWNPAIAERENYDIDALTIVNYNTLKEAVTAGRQLSKEKGIPLAVSTAYLNRPETEGIQFWNNPGLKPE